MKTFVWKTVLILLTLCLVLTTCDGAVDAGKDNDISDNNNNNNNNNNGTDGEEEIAADHWWVTYENENGVTTDFDALKSSSGFAIDIDPTVNYQEITQGFGASDCWSGNFVGRWKDSSNNPHPNLEKISDWLFSQEFDGNNPKGIGLSQWRVNLGGGSWDQSQLTPPEDPKIGTRTTGSTTQALSGTVGWNSANGVGTGMYKQMDASWERRGQSYLKNIKDPPTDFSGPLSARISKYDFENNCLGQQYFMREARKRGTEIFNAFSNSPLVCWTINGYANNIATGTNTMDSSGKYTKLNDTGNLKTDKYYDFASYLGDVAEYFEGQKVTGPDGTEKSLRFNYISPVNEPQWEWNENKQEGSRWNNANIYKLAVEMNKAFRNSRRPWATINNETDEIDLDEARAPKIMITEAAQWDHIYTGATTGLYGQMEAFWSTKSAATYLGNLPTFNNPKMMAGHTYFTHGTDAYMKSHREQVRNRAAEFKVDVHSTEWCGLDPGNGISSQGVSTIDSYWECALYMAKIIYADLTIANAKSWVFWTALDMERGGKSRYSLIGYAPGSPDTYNLNSYTTHAVTEPGYVKTQPTLWVLGNYSLFIRPGFRRIKLAGVGVDTNQTSGLMGSAYISPNNFKDAQGNSVQRVVAVYVNMNNTAYKFAAQFPDKKKPSNVRCYLTNQSLVGTEAVYAPNPGLRYQATDTSNPGVFNLPGKSVLTVVYDF